VKQNSVTSDERDPLEENILHHAVASHYQLDALTPEEELALEERQMDLESDNDPKISIDTSEDEVAVEEIAPIPVISDNRLSFTDWLHADANYTPQSDAAHTITGVVEDFSDFDPMKSLYGEVEKPKKEFFSPAKKAKESLSEDKLPVSETLAKVYVMQGNYPKAIQAYNELILAFPEKKIFFANQIEDLKKKLNK
jgi:hypothetical protein